jgi:hypothetical protein
VHNEPFLSPREGTQEAPVKVGIRDTQVCERLWLTLATCRLGDADHDYILPYLAGGMCAIRRPPSVLRTVALAESRGKLHPLVGIVEVDRHLLDL